MTPCEKMGYKVGDNFEMLVSAYGWEAGEVVKLVRDDGSNRPDFEGVTTPNRRYDDNRMFLCIDGDEVHVKPITISKLRPAKQALADAIHASGKGWPDGANWAVQVSRPPEIFFASGQEKPVRSGNGYRVKSGGLFQLDSVIKCDKLLPNWHQTVLSREEYFSAYPEKGEPVADADGWIEWCGGECPVSDDTMVSIRVRGEDGSARGKASHWHWGHSGCGSDIIAYRFCEQPGQCCESVTRSIPEPAAKPTIEQLASDYRNKLDFANRKQQEADDAKAAADAALGELIAAGKAIDLVIGIVTPEPELVITDWRDLQVGDEVECIKSNIGKYNGVAGVVMRIDYDDASTPVCVDIGGVGGIWCHDVKFIRRP